VVTISIEDLTRFDDDDHDVVFASLGDDWLLLGENQLRCRGRG
jgi:hypothetical protein